MDKAVALANYLPLSFKTRSEQDYIAFLWEPQFTFLAYPMSFVYFNIWQIRQTRLADLKKGFIGFGKDIEKPCWAQPRPLSSAL